MRVERIWERVICFWPDFAVMPTLPMLVADVDALDTCLCGVKRVYPGMPLEDVKV